MKSAALDKLHEKCAVVGVSTNHVGDNEAARIAYQALFALQHRGAEGSGIVTTDGSELRVVRAPGMVRDVYHDDEIAYLQGKLAVGHNRYSTNGDRHAHLQPVINDSIGFAFAHNGNLPDTDVLEAYLTKRRYVTSQYNDSELFGNALASKLHGGRDIEAAVREVCELAVGAYACVGMHDGIMFGFRDPHGIRPLELGEFDGGMILASETCALDTVGAKHMRSVKPGELVVIRDGELVLSVQFAPATEHFDVFELVYFARHDSIMNGQRVNEVRRRFGEELAKAHVPWQKSTKSVLVTAVPDTSVPAAEAYAESLNLSHQTAVIKNRYIGRTFMQPTQASRQSNLRLKHTLISERIKGRDVYLIDDSIVRGNTLPRLIALVRESGAKSVSVLIASPPIRFPDFYGVDTPQQVDLMAANLTVEQMRVAIGADYLGFLSVSAMVRATGIPRKSLNLAAFTGEYPVDIGKQRVHIKKPASNEYMT
ncbi:MAG: amidophosphoribosyltransferase [Candidatus Saccharimonadales bacterium]